MMSVSLAPDLEQLILEKVEGGLYRSPEEVVREALELLSERDAWRQASLEALRNEVAIGIEQADRGQIGPLDREAVRAKASERGASSVRSIL